MQKLLNNLAAFAMMAAAPLAIAADAPATSDDQCANAEAAARGAADPIRADTPDCPG
jgi:hypothetical protein